MEQMTFHEINYEILWYISLLYLHSLIGRSLPRVFPDHQHSSMFLSKTITAVLGLCSLFGPAAAWTNPIRNPGGSDPHMVTNQYILHYFHRLRSIMEQFEWALFL